MARRIWIGASSTLLTAVVAGALTTPLWAAAPVVLTATPQPAAVTDAGGAVDAATTAVAAPHCGGDPSSSPVPVAEEASHAGEVTQSLTVTVPPTAILHLDETGTVVAAITNTGCPPRAGDDVWVRRAGAAELEAASWAAYRSQRWTGDFTRPGVMVPQQVG